MRDTDAEHRSRFTVWRPIGLGGFLYRTIRSCLACFGRSLKWGQGGRGSDTIYFDQPIYNGAISPYSLARPFSLQLVPHPPPYAVVVVVEIPSALHRRRRRDRLEACTHRPMMSAIRPNSTASAMAHP